MKRMTLLVWFMVALQLSCVESRPGQRAVYDPPHHTPSPAVADYLRTQDIDELISVQTWPNRFGPGLCLYTEHYEILTTLVDPVFLQRLPEFVEASYQAYNQHLPIPISAGSRSTIYLFENRSQWEDFTRSFAGRQASLYVKIQEGAYCHQGSCVAYDIGLHRTLAAIGHEGWHQFNSRHFKYRLPSWLDEGIAMQFESPRRIQGQLRFDPYGNHYRLGSLTRILRQQNQLSLPTLLGISPGEVMASDRAESVMAFYSQSYALVRFLQEARNQKYLRHYQALVYDGLQGKWPLCKKNRRIAEDRNQARTIKWNSWVGKKLFAHYICSDLDAVELEFLDFCQHISQ